MDNLKLYVKKDIGVEGLLKSIKRFTDDLGMEFELDRYTNATLRSIKLVKKTNIKLNVDSIIQEPGQKKKMPKYKRVNEKNGIQYASMKEEIWKDTLRKNMSEYGFSLTRIFSYKDRVVDTVLIRENTGQRKPIFCLTYFTQWELNSQNRIIVINSLQFLL